MPKKGLLSSGRRCQSMPCLLLCDPVCQVKMRERQLHIFQRTDCVALSTVDGMLKAHGTSGNGEITPLHLCDLLQEVLQFCREAQNEANGRCMAM